MMYQWRWPIIIAACLMMSWLPMICFSQSLPSNAARYVVKESFGVGENVSVRALAIDERSQTLWVGTSVGGLAVDYRTGNMKNTYTRANGLANEYIFAAFAAQNGEIWLGTNGGGVSRLTATGWQTYFPMHGLADYWVYSFAEQNSGDLWIGTWAGVSVFNRKTGKFSTYLKELVNEWIYGLAVDNKDRVWIGTEGGVNMYDGNSWWVWTHQDGLGAPNAQNLPFSKNTGLGTRSRHDLSVLAGASQTYNPNYVFCLQVDKKQQIWAGTWGGGVSRYDGETWQNYTMVDGLAGNIVYSMAQDAQGGLWFGTNHGLSNLKNGQWQNYTMEQGLFDNHVYAIAASDDGNVWVGTKKGVTRFVAPK